MKDSQSMLVSRFARLGAIVRLRQIDEEAAAIRKMFPRLTATAAAADEAGPGREAAAKRREVSPAAREAARQRMKAYWARKRQAAAGPADAKVEASERPSRPAARRRGRGPRAAAKRGRKPAGKRSR